MPYIYRNESGKISKISVRALVGGDTLPHNHPEVMEFLKHHNQDPTQVELALKELQRTDGEMARAIEDVVIVLMKKNLIKMTDLPKPVQDRMSNRIKQRVLIQDIYDQASGSKATD